MSEISGQLLSPPLMMNPLKHHAGHIVDYIKSTDITSYKGAEALKTDLSKIGKSQMDLYTGDLSVKEIERKIMLFLKGNRLLEKESYVSWLKSSDQLFRTINISDGSRWILLSGNLPERWVHIHPGRYSPFTLRVRSDNLKTAIAVICYSNNYGPGYPGIEIINQVRINLLSLSPMKEISAERGTGKLIRLLSGRIQEK